ncbi:MAG: DUF4147 domain-containing protein [Sphingomonadales bacterium]|nr:DUF4147 domain-containing protein [Sphingomonadales bacterium]
MARPDTITDAAARALLRAMFDAAVARADAGAAVLRHLPERPRGRCVVIGAGKAAAVMAAAVDAAWPDVALSGVVATPHGHGVPAGRIEVIEAGHPVPDADSERAARAVLAALDGLTADDLVLALVSGGGSASLALPVAGVTLAEKQAITRALLACGAPIGAINAVRKALSRVKGGRLLARAAPARVVTLLISDVPGDDPATIASGPTVPDEAPPVDALAVLDRYGIAASEAVRDAIRGNPPPLGGRGEWALVATPAQALAATAEVARVAGVAPVMLGDAIEGEAAEAARDMAAQALAWDAPRPAVLLSGGETTVTLGSSTGGNGGRNSEFALALALALDGAAGVWAIAGDSDGIDGASNAAGAVVTPDTLARARQAGLDPAAMLTQHDSHALFAALGDAVVTGPTRTNVNDIRAILIT